MTRPPWQLVKCLLSNLFLPKKLQSKANPFVTSHEISKFRNFSRFVMAFWRRKLLKFYYVCGFSGKYSGFHFGWNSQKNVYSCAHWSIRISSLGSFSWELILIHLKNPSLSGLAPFIFCGRLSCNQLTCIGRYCTSEE